MTTHSERAAAWILGLKRSDIPDAVVESTKLHLLDTLGLILAAGEHPLGRAASDAARALGTGKGSHILGHGDETAPALAALANGAMAEGLLFDDTHNETIIHVSAPIVATALALGEATKASGATLLAAIVGGTELTCRIGLVAPGQFHKRGLHPTGIIGTLGAALTASRLLGLDVAQARHALGIAGSFAAGINESWTDGSWTQLLHPGWAAHAGIAAATLAKSGYTGPGTVLEGRFGLFRTHVQDPEHRFDFERLFAGLGEEWETLRLSFKPYPCAHVIHPFLDALVAIRARHGIAAKDVQRITCPIAEYMIPVVAAPVEEKQRPAGEAQARTSLQYSLAELLHLGRLGADGFREASVRDPAILDLARRVEIVIDKDAPGTRYFKGWVIVETRDGRRLEHIEKFNRGSADNPMSRADVLVKFRDNVRLMLPAERAGAIEEAVAALDEAPSLDRLVRAAIR
jgi:2-methylcitrate dehydratase PrpD